MDEKQKIGLTEALLGLVIGLTIWLANQVFVLAQLVSSIQQHNLDQDRRIERIEDASPPYPTESGSN